ncbi:glycosyltransferase [Streptomyces sp. NBC_01387]|uniref:glycosyltransferase n=1 Tax=Streptomyces sp. NBC_01387 TaxID=2903849 RepID=UPI003868302A
MNFARFFLGELLPGEDKVIYLDIDTIVQGDIWQLFRVELGDPSPGPGARTPPRQQTSHPRWNRAIHLERTCLTACPPERLSEKPARGDLGGEHAGQKYHDAGAQPHPRHTRSHATRSASLSSVSQLSRRGHGRHPSPGAARSPCPLPDQGVCPTAAKPLFRLFGKVFDKPHIEGVDPCAGGDRVGRVMHLVVVQLLAGQTRPGQRQGDLPVAVGKAAPVQHAQAAFSSGEQGEAGALVVEVGVLGGARCDVVEQLVPEFLEHHAHRVAALVDVLETLLDTVRLVAESLVEALLVHGVAWRVADLHR